MAKTDLGKVLTLKLFFGAHPYEVRFGKDQEGYFYEIGDMESLGTVAGEDGLSRDGFIAAVGGALEPWQFEEFEQLVFSLG